MRNFSLPAVIRERASLQPNDTAFTYIDYERDWDGFAETLTWLQLYRRTLNVAHQLRFCGTTGDRAVILAPQGLDYIVAFLGAMEAGRIPVPLSLPMGGATDERVTSVLADATPTVVLTTSAVVDTLASHIQSDTGTPAPSIIEVDQLDTANAPSRRVNGNGDPSIAYLQYTSGSTRMPAGVMVTNENIRANFEQICAAYFLEYGKVAPADTTFVSWLPFYHDMGLFVGVLMPILTGRPGVLFSPATFLQRPARWVQLLAKNTRAFSAAPNFAFDLAVRRTTDDDMAGLDLGNVLTILSGSERVQPATIRRFTERFNRYNLRSSMIRPSYGMAEAAVYLASRTPAQPPEVVHFDAEKLSAGEAIRTDITGGATLLAYGMPDSPLLRIVDPETGAECPQGKVGEIWAHGENIAPGYWERSEETNRAFGATISALSPDTPEKPWLRTGDLGFVSENELFIIGRIKDLLIVYGRNHSPDDIEATINEITRGRCAAISVPGERSEQLVAIIEVKNRAESFDDGMEAFGMVKREVTSAISNSHGLSVADLVLVPPGSIPTTTSGKVRRAACVEHYRHGRFARLDA
ncbi:acyl-CoA synthetase [Mycobacterium sp. ACS1612]|uniref:AMP-binding protein n=1 Tax=Mycobacterium sp. ACS1612 TaxID=1834117 RepID=UPI0008018CDA|nr:AMP-binding protein [Mycobacterium sp. ACS1612]OBF25991.1 acyl-CoA synthetase [Mycobacterium sp. ACS1612]